MTTEDINNFVELQLDKWELARKNFDALAQTERKKLNLGKLECAAQYNPARIRSTGAKTDAESIRKRACFLCKENRPPQQSGKEWIPGWELLVNPYPILPIHFTISDISHRPQDGIPVEMASMAEKAPDLVIFYNGAKAGASAPDHRHCQAVLKSELPLLRIAEEFHSREDADIVSSESFGIDLPFLFLSAIIKPTREGMMNLEIMTKIRGVDSQTGKADKDLVNAFFWIDAAGYLRIIVIPRKAHRPACFFADDDTHLMVSPGALDMAGLLILPDKSDFNKIDSSIAAGIYGEVAFADHLPAQVLPD